MAAYLDCGRSLARAGERLHVARNTVAYRVKKAERILVRCTSSGWSWSAHCD